MSDKEEKAAQNIAAYEKHLYENSREFGSVKRAMALHRSAVDSVCIIEVIEVISRFGLGIEEDPVRQVTEHFTLDGHLIARSDPWADKEEE